ncbi:hypothetical protein ACFYXM_29450 [Streptomyces sp. NPDC002476]|uniref:hypothetical protein n=1 Tax=Streptomyces sp. NPDC002476 TaxID=3364648 RepID=UPI0036CC1D19
MAYRNASTAPAPGTKDTAGTTGVARTDGLLRTALMADVVLTGANGIGYLALAAVLDSFLGVPRPVEYAVGVFLTVYAAWLLSVSRRAELHRGAVAFVIALNTAWAVASVVTVLVDALTATGIGNGWIVFQGLTVAGMGALQYLGLRRM